MGIFRRAITDTVTHLSALFLAIIGGVISLIALYFLKGETMAFEEIPYVIAGIIGVVGGAIFAFIWNLACAPYRNERDKRLALEAKIGAVDDKEISRLKRQDSFFLWEAACLLAGVPPRYPVAPGGGSVYLEKLKLEFLNDRLSLVDNDQRLEHIRTMYRASKLMPNLERPSIDDNINITKTELIRYARENSIEIIELGLTPQSPADTPA